MIIVHANLFIKPEQEAVFLEEVKSLLAATRAEEGNVSYELMKSTEQEHKYTMVELWKDMEAAGAHNASAHFTAFTHKAKELLAAPMELQIFSGEPLKI